MPHHIFEDMDLEIGTEVFLILKLRRIRAYEGKIPVKEMHNIIREAAE